MMEGSITTDSFLVFYGIKIPIPADNEELHERIYHEIDPRCEAATRVGLDKYFGSTPENGDYFLYIGEKIAFLGEYSNGHLQFKPHALAKLADRVNGMLIKAGFKEVPALQFQCTTEYEMDDSEDREIDGSKDEETFDSRG